MPPGLVRRILAGEMGSVKNIQRHFSVVRFRYGRGGFEGAGAMSPFNPHEETYSVMHDTTFQEENAHHDRLLRRAPRAFHVSTTS